MCRIFFLFVFSAYSCVSIAQTHISEYDLTIQLHFSDSSFSAVEKIKVSSDGDIALDATNLQIDSIRENTDRMDFSYLPGKLKIHLPAELLHLSVELSVFYHAKPTTGLVIH
ncbi:MAG TPA: hypothetical protein VGM92_10835, partial [Candidatus Kapabacteria bacterium]